MTQQQTFDLPGSGPDCPSSAGCPHRLTEIFGIDLRTLALLRVVVGTLLLLDILFRVRDLDAFYTDWGVLPRAALLEKFSGPWLVSIHLMSGQAWAMWLLFLIAAVLAVMMIVGYHTRVATVLSWFMLLSIQNRNTMVNDGGDDILRCLMFFLMLLPLGARFSIDALRGLALQKPKSNRHASVASGALLVQVCLIYWFTAELKNHPIWWHGKAVSYALQLDIFATPLGHYMLNFPRLLVVLTYVTLWTEILGPTLAFFPIGTRYIRLAVIAAFISLHAGLGLCMALGIFPFICMAAWLSFLPGCFWDWIEPRVRLPNTAWLNIWVREHLKPRSTEEPSPDPTWLGNTIAFCAIAFAIIWNLRMVDEPRWRKFLPASIEQIGLVFRLDQNWKLFAPYPMTEDGWYVMPGRLVNGSEADVWTGGPVTWEKPPLVSATFPNSRWRKYMVNIWIRSNADHRAYFAGYLCRRWDATHTGDLKMDTFRIFYMEEDSQPDASVVKPVPRMLWQHWCIKMPTPATKPGMSAAAATQPSVTRPATKPATQPASRPAGGELLPRR